METLTLILHQSKASWQGSDRNAARTNTMSRFETETLTQEDNLKGLALMNPQWVELAMAHTPHRRVILDMDSSESPVHGQQEGAAYNGHFECVCYHPLFLFNADGEFRIRYKGNRRVVTYKNVVSFLQPMMDEVSQLNFGIDIHRTPVPMAEVYSLKERISHKALRWRRAAGRFVASPTLTIVLNILLAIAVIAQAVALILR